MLFFIPYHGYLLGRQKSHTSSLHPTFVPHSPIHFNFKKCFGTLSTQYLQRYVNDNKVKNIYNTVSTKKKLTQNKVLYLF